MHRHGSTLVRSHWTHPITMATLLLAGCAGMQAVVPEILIETAARGAPLNGAACVAMIADTRWDVVTPGRIALGDAHGTLRVVCNHAGFRSSELIFRPAGTSTGFSRSSIYPKKLVLDLNAP